ncbi:ABC transporter permease [Pseudalkalibacillus salsuginis]|uniref:ABC transporter permease n=1 Tax=Pseudalkalibacillus salsuginis TaxID=2910972 RepID=UPI001F20BFE7|nr:ABC transporter permease [Pseudalkalibacillus salsuginis]MCF6408904.1 ABC transporter permease [Pseudalkalibacillus salsuginis]
MRFKDQFKFVRQNMKKNKTRIFMTVLATAMGCAFLIVLASVGFGLQKSIVEEITQDRLMTEIQVHGKENEENAGITMDDITYFEGLDHVKAVTRRQMVDQQGEFRVGEFRAEGNAVVVDFPSETKAGFELSEGRLPEADNEVVIGHDFAESLAKWNGKETAPLNEDGTVKEEFKYKGKLIGETLNLGVKQYEGEEEKSKTFDVKIVGIGKKPTKDWEWDPNIYISEKVLSEIEAFTGTPNGTVITPNLPAEERDLMEQRKDRFYSQVSIYADDVENVKTISETIKDKKYFAYSVVDEMEQINTVFLIVKSGLIFIGTIAIIIASIGIYNTMTMAVTERAPDIGIMKAIGANPSTIKRIFLIESSYIGLLGAIFGTIVAYLITLGVNWLLPIILSNAFGEPIPGDFKFSHIPLSLPLICIGICLVVTILSGLRPARRATKVDVLKAMRREV